MWKEGGKGSWAAARIVPPFRETPVLEKAASHPTPFGLRFEVAAPSTLAFKQRPLFGRIRASPFLSSFQEKPEQPLLLLVSSNFPLGALTLSARGVAAGQRAAGEAGLPIKTRGLSETRDSQRPGSLPGCQPQPLGHSPIFLPDGSGSGFAQGVPRKVAPSSGVCRGEPGRQEAGPWLLPGKGHRAAP